MAGAAGVTLGQPEKSAHPSMEEDPAAYEPRVRKVFGFMEFEEPRRIKEPMVDDAHARDLAGKADVFFGRGFDPNEIEFVFYEEAEMDYLRNTYGEISPMGHTYFETLEAYRKSATHNDAMIATHIPIMLSLGLILVSLFMGYCVMGQNVPAVLAPLSDLKVSLAVQGGASVLALLIYVMLFKIPYLNSQRISVVNFDNYVQSISNFSRTQFTQLKSEFLKVEQRLGQNTDDVLALSRDYSSAICWVMFASFLLRSSIRNILFHHRRNLALWKISGLLVIIMVVGCTFWGVLSLAASNTLISGTPVWNLVALGGGLVMLMLLQNVLSNQANQLPDTWMDMSKWKLFGSPSLGVLTAVQDMAAAEKTKIIQFRDRYAGSGGGGAVT